MPQTDANTLIPWLEQAIQRLSPAEQRKLAREIGKQLRIENRKRINAQISPEGTPFAPRQIREKALTSHIRNRGNRNPHPQRGNPPRRFTYKGKQVELKSYREEGGMLIGFDRVSKQVKAYKKANIGKPKPKHSDKMFKKLRTASRLKIKAQAHGVKIGWTGQDGHIARVHQYGWYDAKTGGNYPSRELLGFSPKDLEMIKNLLIERLAPQ